MLVTDKHTFLLKHWIKYYKKVNHVKPNIFAILKVWTKQ